MMVSCTYRAFTGSYSPLLLLLNVLKRGLPVDVGLKGVIKWILAMYLNGFSKMT